MTNGVPVMPRVLLVGYEPEAVDYSNPALPPGMNAEKIRAGYAVTLKDMADRGWEGVLCLIRPDQKAVETVERHLAAADFACVVVGAGVRLPPQSLVLFEPKVTRSVVLVGHRHRLQHAARRHGRRCGAMVDVM